MMMIVVVVLVISTQGISVSYQWRGRLQYLIASIIASTMFLIPNGNLNRLVRDLPTV